MHWGHAVSADDAVGGCWYVTRYADVQTGLRDLRLGRQSPTAPPPDLADLPESIRIYAMYMRSILLFMDPPDHTRLRGLVARAFSPRMLERLRPRVAAIADGLLDRVADQGTMDLMADFAQPLPIQVIAELIGIPASDAPRLKGWSQILTASIDFGQSQAIYEQANQAAIEFALYMLDQIAQRRTQPGDDLLSDLLQAHDQGDRLSEPELLSTLGLILIAGHETTTNLIGNGALALLHFPDQLARLQADPGLMVRAVEEFLRFDGPTQSAARVVQEPFVWHDQPMEPGQAIMFMTGAANRDPLVFAAPDRLDVGRDPNRHLAFGGGMHYCLGAALARLEGEIAFATLLRRLPDLRWGASRPVRNQLASFRGLASLPVAF